MAHIVNIFTEHVYSKNAQIQTGLTSNKLVTLSPNLTY